MLARLCLCLVALLPIAGAASADEWEWKETGFEDSPIEFWVPWADVANSRHGTRWAEGYRVQSFVAVWWDAAETIWAEILVQRPAAFQRWGSLEKIDKSYFRFSPVLSEQPTWNLQDLPCEAHHCVTFEILHAKCAAFHYATGSLGNGNESTGADVVLGYFCSRIASSIDSTRVNKVIQSIRIRQDF